MKDFELVESQIPENQRPDDFEFDIFYRFGLLIVSRPLIFVLLPVVLCLVLSGGMFSLDSTPDSRIFFSDDNPQLKALEIMEAEFSKSDNVFIAIQSKEGSIFSPRMFELILALTEASWQVPYSNKVASISNYQLIGTSDDTLVVRDLIENDVKLNKSYVEQAESYVMSKPVLLGRMVSQDGSVTGINVTIQKPIENPKAVFEVIDHVSNMVENFSHQYPDAHFYVTGGAAFDAAFSEIPARENLILAPLMFVVIVVILGISFQSVWFVVVAISLMGLAVGSMLGVTGWLGAQMNAGTAGAPVIVLTLAVAYCVHVIVSIRQQILSGLEKTDAIAESLRVNVVPVAITGLTTAVGFLSLNFSDAPPFRQLGNMVAFGVIVTFILSITFLPAVLSLIKFRVSTRVTPVSVHMASIARFVVFRKRSLLCVGGATIVFIGLGATKIVLDDNFIEYFDSRYRLRGDTDFVERNLTGMNALEYPVSAGTSGGIANPAYLQTLERFEKWLQSQDKVTGTVSIVEMFRDLNRSMQGGDPKHHVIPETRELAAQLLLLYEMSLPFGQELTHQIDIEQRTSKVVVLVKNASSADLRELNSRAEHWLASNTNLPVVQGTGLSLIFAYISQRNIYSMLFGSLFALVVISFILIFALRSLPLGLLSLVPNLVPAAMGLGVWGYFVGTAGLSVAVVVAITLGIVVDDTVHFLSKYIRARRELGFDAEESVHFAFRTVGVALWITSLTLVAGFGVLAFSGFKVTAEMGLLSAVTIALALVADFFFLPPLLMAMDRKSL